MDAFIFFILFSSFIFSNVQGLETNSPTLSCSHGGAPTIQFPFQIEGHDTFKLLCKDNTTIIHFPDYGDLIVKSISYNPRKLDLLDPKNCVHQVFLNLNLSHTPFQYYYVVKKYTYLSCSARLPPSFSEIPCLSGSENHVYTVESSLPVPASCRVVKTVEIPLPYSPYLSDNSFGLGLTWDLPASGCEDCESKGCHRGFNCGTEQETRCFYIPHEKVLIISIFVIAMATLISIKIYYYSKKMNGQIKEENQMEGEKLQGDYKALQPERSMWTSELSV